MVRSGLAGVLVLAILCAPLVAGAQDSRRTEQLERRLMALEQKLFSMQEGGTAEDASMADFEVRLQQLEQEASKVYGAVEELGHSVSKLADKIDMISKDVDMRLRDLEQATPAQSAEKSAQKQAPEKKATSSENKPAASEAAVASPKPRDDKTVPADLAPEAHYSKAYNYIVATAYPTAEIWLKEFLTRHPKHDLADNAHYWLGEVYLVQDDEENAIISFAKGLKEFPKGSKAAANLLKMGVAFERIGKVDHARSSWEKLMADFPEAPEVEKAKAFMDNLDSSSAS